jgi:hypothetical protein
MKRSVNNFAGTIKTDAARGQKLVTPVGKDSSDYSGGKRKEVPQAIKMGGGMNNLSDTLGEKA